MIKNLKIDNFKCFDKIDIELNYLNLFCGTNSSGKSSAIQSLLMIDNCLSNENSFNSQWLNLGNFEESRNFNIRRENINISLNQNDNEYELLISETEIKCTQDSSYNTIKYISANRVGPRNFYHKMNSSKNFIGENGEFLIDYLYSNLRTIVDKERLVDFKSETLDYQVNFWLNRILKANIILDNIISGNIVTANYSYSNNKKVRPYHIGAGLSYLIGILIVCLSAKKNETIVIENPEIHLHPKAQSELSYFLAFVSNSGVQLIIETHSDHIFNGIRKAVFKNAISKDKVKIHFFELDENYISINHKIDLTENGRVINVKEDLFDQFDNDLDELLNLA